MGVFGSALLACSSKNGTTSASGSTTSGSSTSSSSATTGAGGGGGAPPDPTAICKAQSLTTRAWSAGPYGTHRGDIADDFSLDLADGTTFSFKTMFSGCESYVFIPDRIRKSQADTTSIWTVQADLDKLVKQSPKNVHYFFVSTQTTDALAMPDIQAQQGRVMTTLSKLSQTDAALWTTHLHVVAKKAADLGGWIPGVLSTHGQIGFSIDRLQKIRGAGDLADVTRTDPNVPANGWPFVENLSYAANYPAYFNAQSDQQEKLDAETATVVDLWKGEVLTQGFADTMAMLPSASDMAGFDTLEIEVTQQCPDPDKIEIGNCGAWDYIASLTLNDDPQNPVELARFITSYHRETHWVVDASEMLPILASGGQHAIHWTWAPSWNMQPTATKLSLRFSNKNKGMHPKSVLPLFQGGDFGSMYNTGRIAIMAPIPATAKKVELYVIVTGHGSGTNQCSEFCDHQHEFTVNTTKHLKDFPEAGTETKCMPNDVNGMTPNQAGTWWYGRGGWCPGMQVNPWVVDVTSDVTPGQTATIS